jgi:drug/metabolite transporter (DMT)-like permease
VTDGSSGSKARISATDVGLLVVLSVLWGAAYIFIREGIVLGASPILFAGVRYAFSAAAFCALAAARRESFPTRHALLLSLTVGGIFVIGLYGGFLYWGEQYTTGGYAAVLASTAPILTVAFAFALLPAERLSSLGLLGILIGFLGVIVLVVPQLEGSPVGTWPGPAFAIGAFVSAAIGTVLLRRWGTGPQGLWQIGGQFGVAALLLGVASFALPVSNQLPLTPGVLGSLAALVIFSSVGGYFVYFRLHHRIGPIGANSVAYLIPLVGVGIGSGFFGEPVTLEEILGFLIVIAGVTLVIRSPPHPAPTPPMPSKT